MSGTTPSPIGDRCALYYPTLEFRDPEWLWSSALVWDRIYRICPRSVHVDDVPSVRELMEDGEIGVALDPAPYLQPVAERFREKVNSNEWDASALDPNAVNSAYSLVHRDKVDVAIRELLLRGRSSAEADEWLPVSRYDAALYMTLLAKELAESNGLRLVTDSTVAWTGELYFENDGKVQVQYHDEAVGALASIVVADFTPRNILDIGPRQLLNFRRKYRDERREFLASLEESARKLTAIQDPQVVDDALHDLKTTIDKAVTDYRRCLGVLNVTSWDGIKTLSFPLAGEIVQRVIEVSADMKGPVSWLGMSFGAAVALSDLRQQRKKLRTEAPFSYLYHVRNEFPDSDVFSGHLRSAMYEFVED